MAGAGLVGAPHRESTAGHYQGERAIFCATEIGVHLLAGVSFNPEVICQGKSNPHVLN